MSYLTSQIIPAIQVLKIIGNLNEFEKWMQAKHPEKNINDLFEGYKFSLNCCLNTFVYGISRDSELEIKNDFLLDCAISELKPIHLIQNTCEKTIFLKNIKPIIKAIVKSKDYKEISQALTIFNNSIALKFESIFQDCIIFSPEIAIGRKTANNLLLIDFAHTFLGQIKNNGPIANFLNPLSVNWIKQEKKEQYLIGFKYAIEFLWFQLVDEEQFDKTHLSKIHLADSWKKYTYLAKESSGDPMIDMLNNEFSLEEQTNLDSYFYWIKEEITTPLAEKYNTPIYLINSHFRFENLNYNKHKLFKEFLDGSKIKNEPNLNWEEKIEQCLYWYSFEIVDSTKAGMFFGIPSFNTMLAGTVALYKPKESEFSKIIAVKFTHPHLNNDKNNDYSYGILIDTKSSAGHYSSGWVIYQNACGDYSGFSGSEYKATEELIAKYQNEEKVELRELKIPLKEFQDYTNKYILNHKQLSILEQNKLIPDIIQKSRAHLFELFTYYLCSKYYGAKREDKKMKIDLNSDRNTNEGEKDVVVYNDDEVILIECKLNPQSYKMEDLIKKMEIKLKKYSQKQKSCQFWFWDDLSVQNRPIIEQARIEGEPIKIIIVSNPNREEIFQGVYFKNLKFIMQDYNTLNEIDYSTVMNGNNI